MSDDGTSDSYDVGYRKPPKNTQFQKGISGNPRGRPKTAWDFDRELLRKASLLLSITENGQRIHVSEHTVAIKQLMKQAMTGHTHGLRTYRLHFRQAQERIALMADSQPSKPVKTDVKTLTDEELMEIIWRSSRYFRVSAMRCRRTSFG